MVCRDVWNMMIKPKYVPYDPEKLSLQTELELWGLPLKNCQFEAGQIFVSKKSSTWTKDNFSGSYSPNLFQIELSLFWLFLFWSFFVVPTCLHGMIFFQLFCEFCSKKYTIFFAISHLYWKFSNREEKKKMQKKVHHSVGASSCEKTKTKFYNYCIMHCVTFFVRLSFLDKSIKLNQ